MSRIKFRAWDGKRFHYWGKDLLGKGTFTYSPNPTYEDTEYTGLKDKNDTEIYDGDIVKKWWGCGFGGNEIIRNHEIKLYVSGNEMAWHLGETHNLWSGGDVEVIGNIYENPELLGKGYE